MESVIIFGDTLSESLQILYIVTESILLESVLDTDSVLHFETGVELALSRIILEEIDRR